jgi:hypothetical protein
MVARCTAVTPALENAVSAGALRGRMSRDRAFWQPFTWALHFIVLLTGAIHAWHGRFAINPDGVAYLDLAERYAQGDWAAALNGYWSPLYPALLGVVLSIARPFQADDLVLAHGVNFGLYVAAYGAFLRLTGELQRFAYSPRGHLDSEGGASHHWRRVGATALFLWSTPGLVYPHLIVPDMLGLALVLLTAATALQIHGSPGSRAAYAGLGVLLGLGYLARSALLLLGPVWLLGLLLTAARRPRSRRGVAVAAAAFALVCVPLIVALSISKGRVTFGDAGRLNYAWYVNGPRTTGPNVERPGARLVHAVRRVSRDPAVYEFASPVIGTYPVWTDPSYWQEGTTAHVDAVSQWKVLREHLGRYGMIFAPALAAGLVLGIAVASRELRRTIGAAAPVLLPSIAGLLLYALVHTERRHVAPFVLIATLTVGYVLRVPRTVAATRLLVGVVLAEVALLLRCGLANLVCGTGTTTAAMLLIAEAILAAAIVGTWYSIGSWRGRDLGILVFLVGVSLLGGTDTIIVAPAVLVLTALLVAGREGSDPGVSGVWVTRGVGAWAAAVLVLPIGVDTLVAGRAVLRGERGSGYAAVETARALQALGVRPGDPLASVGNSFEAYWAQIAGARIVAEIPEPESDKFWRGEEGAQARALDAMTAAGARAVVADWSRAAAVPPGWRRVDDEHLVRWLDRGSNVPPSNPAGASGAAAADSERDVPAGDDIPVRRGGG